MPFKPFGKKYDFSKEILIKDFPQYFHSSISDWLYELLQRSNVIDTDYSYIRSKSYIKTTFLNQLEIDFRETFPQYWSEFIAYLLSDTDRLCNFLAFCLQKFSDEGYANWLDNILVQGGSAYGIIKTNESADEYTKGVYDLVERVPENIKTQAEKAITDNDLLKEAWVACYSRNPDYEKVVIKCQNFLEHLLKDKYDPNNQKAQLGVIIGNLKKTSNKIDFKGRTVMSDPNQILLLIDNVPKFRGMHTAGTGKVPGKDEAEFILHSTIFIWNLHQK